MWTINDVERHIKGLSIASKRIWVKVANDARERCLATGKGEKICDASAIRQANTVAKQVKTTEKDQVANVTFDEETGWIIELEENCYIADLPLAMPEQYNLSDLVNAFNDLKDSWNLFVYMDGEPIGVVQSMAKKEEYLLCSWEVTDMDKWDSRTPEVDLSFYKNYQSRKTGQVYNLVLERIDYKDME